MTRRIWLLVSLGVATGCNIVAEQAKATLGGGCFLDSECLQIDGGVGRRICLFQRCMQECRTDFDCRKDNLNCVGDGDDAGQRACLLEDSCRSNFDCPVPLLCGPDNRCRERCSCENGQQCTCPEGAACFASTCANPETVAADAGIWEIATPCALNSDCKEPFVCGMSGRCRIECRDTRDCSAGFVCREQICRLELVNQTGGGAAGGGSGGGAAGGGSAGGTTRPPGWGQSCVLNSDCSAWNLICVGNTKCGLECLEANDCGTAGSCCRNNLCRTGLACSTTPVAPDGGADGGLDAGCTRDLDCDDAVYCNGVERCIQRQCRPAQRGPCDDENPCTIDTCDETRRTCVTVGVSMPSDLDGDGRFDARCGGGADDCDDNDSRTYPGAPERCDWKDNNCNGLVDENAWQERAGARGVVNSGVSYFPRYGPPRSIALPSGEIRLVVPGFGTTGSIDGYLFDPQLAPIQGPVALASSRTQWTRCGPNQVYGREVYAPRLFSSPTGELLTTGLVTTAPGATCCPTPSSSRTGESLVVRTSDSFGSPDSGVISQWTDSFQGCADRQSGMSNAPSDVAAVWVSSRSHWRLFFSDARAPLIDDQLYTAVLDPVTGAVVSVRPLFVGPGPFISRVDRFASSVNVAAVETSRGLLVFWNQTTAPGFVGTHLRAALFDFDANAVHWGPMGINTELLSVSSTHAGAVVSLTPASPRTNVIQVLPTDLDGGMGPFITLGNDPELYRDSRNINDAWPATNDTQVLSRGEGFFAATVHRSSNGAPTGARSARLSWGRHDGLGGVFSTRLPLGNVIPSSISLAPLSGNRIGAVWIAGAPDGGPGLLTRTIFECVTP